MRLSAAALLATLLPLAVEAQSTVYRHVDADGKVTYSDKPAPGGSPKVQNRVAPDSSARGFDASLNRADAERLYYERQRAEDLQRRPVNVYDPRGSSSEPGSTPGSYVNPRYYRFDPNLPDSPPPSSERRYYYDGR